MTDPIADMLTRIRNAITVKKADTVVPFSNLKFSIAQILKNEGFIKEVEKVDIEDKPGAEMHLILKYKQDQSVIRGLNRISKPGRRVYYNHKEIPGTLPSLGLLIISTSQGLLTNFEAKKKKLGGEVICEIY